MPYVIIATKKENIKQMKDQNPIKTVINSIENECYSIFLFLNHIRQYSKYVSLLTESDIRNPKASYDNEDFYNFLAKIFILQPPKYKI